MAIALRKTGLAGELFGIDLNPENAKKALELGLVDKILPEDEALSKADLVILAIPVNATCAFLPSVLDAADKNATLIDLASTRNLIRKSVASH